MNHWIRFIRADEPHLPVLINTVSGMMIQQLGSDPKVSRVVAPGCATIEIIATVDDLALQFGAAVL